MEITSNTTKTTIDEIDSEISIGALYPLSGPSAEIGKSIADGLEFSVGFINNRCDLPLALSNSEGLPNLQNRKIKLIFADTKGDPMIGQREAERLIKEEAVVALIGAYHSDVTELASLTAEAYKIPFLAPEATAHSLTRRDFKWFFRTGPEDITYSNLFFDYLKFLKEKGEQVSEVTILGDESYTSKQEIEIELNLIRRYGFKLSALEIYPECIKSLLPQLEHIKNCNPDTLFVQQQNVSDAVWTVKILKHLGFFPKGFLAQGSGYNTKEFLEILGEDSNYIICARSWLPGVCKKKTIIEEINSLFNEKFEKDIDDDAAKAFTGLIVLASAINNARSTNSKAIRDALRNINIPGDRLIMPWRGVKFDSNGQNNLAEGILGQIVNGEYKIIWPLRYAEIQAVWPSPIWIEPNEEDEAENKDGEE
jgi:branched-chain amino acid transport system substrate-binding protein